LSSSSFPAESPFSHYAPLRTSSSSSLGGCTDTADLSLPPAGVRWGAPCAYRHKATSWALLFCAFTCSLVCLARRCISSVLNRLVFSSLSGGRFRSETPASVFLFPFASTRAPFPVPLRLLFSSACPCLACPRSFFFFILSFRHYPLFLLGSPLPASRPLVIGFQTFLRLRPEASLNSVLLFFSGFFLQCPFKEIRSAACFPSTPPVLRGLVRALLMLALPFGPRLRFLFSGRIPPSLFLSLFQEKA